MDDRMSKTAAAAAAFFADFFGGPHHCPPIKPWGHGWCVTVGKSLATYDFDELTRLVFMAHDRCVRVEVCHVNMQLLRICIHPRKRTGQIWDRHPTLESAVQSWRKTHPTPQETP